MLKFKRQNINGIPLDRWREDPAPERERDGYTIWRFEYATPWNKSRAVKCKPYYRVYHNSIHIAGRPVDYPTLGQAITAARLHYQGAQA